MNVAILAVVYYEPDWASGTMADVSHFCPGIPLYLVDRGGVGSLAEAFNRGFREHGMVRFNWVWMLTNIRFGPRALQDLLRGVESSYAAIHPVFVSDHPHLQFQEGKILEEVPFVEFTAPLVRSEVFAQFPLDEKMPYSGHDLDWGHRVREGGWKLGAYHPVRIEHTYIRFKKVPHSATQQRFRMRQAQEGLTKKRLAEKYGENWFEKLRCKY